MNCVLELPLIWIFLSETRIWADLHVQQYQFLYLQQAGKSMKIVKISIVLLFLCLISVQPQVLGIDFGTEFWKAALISPGKNLVIVENSRSERKTLNSIAFQDGVRFFEDDSRSKRLKKPDISYFYLNRLIRSLDTKQPVEGYKMEGDTYVFEDGDKSMTLEQVVAMILKNIKQLASHQAGTDIRDVVISVPANWGFHAKLSLVNAANLADFSVLGLINENSAAAIQYAISRNDTDPINVILFNYGSYNLQASLIKAYGYFDESKNKTIESIQILGHVTKENIGGLKVDEEIANYLAEEFKKKHKKDPKTNKKSWTKLMIKSADVKETLSANRESQVYVEGLIDGLDLNLPINRQIIENSHHFSEISASLDQLITGVGLTKSDIHSVEIIGGASRIPKVSSAIKEFFSGSEAVEIGSHINGDESVAFGAALRAANLSLTFRVKQLHFSDPMNLDTKVVISSPDKGVILEQTLFHLSDHHGARKTISLDHNDEDIKMTVYVGDEIVREFAAKGVAEWKKKHENDNVTGTPNLVIDFMMSSIHIAEIKDIYVNVTLNTTTVRQKVEYEDEEVQIQVPVEKKARKTPKPKVEEPKAEENKTEEASTEEVKTEETKEEEFKEEEKKEEEVKEEQTKTPENESEKKEEEKSGQPEQKVEEPEKNVTRTIKKKVNKTKTIKRQVEEHEVKPKKHLPTFEETFSKYKKFTKDEAEEKKKLLHQYESYEKGLKEKAKIRNDFQSALYSLKNNFEEKYLKTFSKEKELKKLIETVTTELEWLDENAWTATKEQFEEHFKILSDSYHPIYNRTTEYRDREKAYNESMGYLGMVYSRTNELITTHFWLKEKIELHLKKVNETAEFISNKIKEQFERPLNENPIIYNHEMIQKAEDLRNQYYKLKMAPRPKMEDLLKDFKDFTKNNENTAKAEPQEKAQEPVQQRNEQVNEDENVEEETKKDSEDL